ncbi:NAD(P)-binding protein [Ascodesmis nigricans]|uniref:NAD(P)-binding protein n=1 Tax=Ascodesmis nigricans TaxID=341454 RepID=A0A4S2MQ30_9PEZI|nr:NAD(P)-binding protein [Ascodesmis nigricans]
MKGLLVEKYLSGPLDLHPTPLPLPIPSPTQYLIHIHATACNFFDLLQIAGRYQHQPPLPWVAGSEFSGTVLTSPPNAKYPPGTRVFGAAQGGYATHVCAEEEKLRQVPDGWSFVDAAGLFVTAPTSYAGLVVRAGVKKGETVLVHAGAGGVGLAAIQIAKALGARVIASAGSAEKRQVCVDFGADEVIDYSDGEWWKTVLALTGGKGVDVVYDPVGLVDKSLKCVAWNARVLVIGFAAGSIESVKVNRVLLKNCSIVGLHYGMYAKYEPHVVEEVWAGLFSLIAAGKFRPTIWSGGKDYKNGLADVGRALEALGSRKTWGKVVLEVKDEEEEKARL